MKVADVKLTWTKSPSAPISKVVVNVTINGNLTTTEVGAEVEEFMIGVHALGVVSFSIDTFDDEGLKATSETHTFTLGNLEAPLPATGLFHEVVAIRDVPDAPA